MSYLDCVKKVALAAGRKMSEKEIGDIFEKIHKMAADIKSGKVDTKTADMFSDPIQVAAREAAAEVIKKAERDKYLAQKQVVSVAARMGDVNTMIASGIDPLEAVERTIRRSYDGKANVESLEQRVGAYSKEYGRKVLDTWDALGNDFLGFFQNQEKLIALVKELRGEDSGNPIAKKGAAAYRNAAEEMRQIFNQLGGEIGKLKEWGGPQHHSQLLVAKAGQKSWVDFTMSLVDRRRFTDDFGMALDDAGVREFLNESWNSISTNGHYNDEPGQYSGTGKTVNRHAEHRQIPFKDAESAIKYWKSFGDQSLPEILIGHIETMARDIAMVENYGPNPDVTYRTLRKSALKAATIANPSKTTGFEGRAHRMDVLYEYGAGRIKQPASVALDNAARTVSQLNVAGKLGGAMWPSLFGDRVLMETVSHLNNLPALKRWRTSLSLMNPLNATDRRLLQQQGLMLDGIRGGLNRFYEGLGDSSVTGKMANAVMRAGLLNALTEANRGSIGASLFSAIGSEVASGKSFASLDKSDVRTLRNYGITAEDWAIWQKAKLQDLGSGNTTALTPDAIAAIDGIDATAKRNAIIKLLGAVNTEVDFAVVTPGWKERAQFYGDIQRGTVKGVINNAVLQFKTFPFTQFNRMFDAVANKDGYVSKSAMASSLVLGTALAGAMTITVRDMLSGKDPRDTTDPRFWTAALISGGGLGIYGDFIYGMSETRYGSGPVEVLSGPSIGPLLELTLVQPMRAMKQASEGKETQLAAQTFQDLKGFIPGNNLWFTKAATDNMIMYQVMEQLSPGYLARMRQKSLKEYGQDRWWVPGEMAPDRPPDLGAAIGE